MFLIKRVNEQRSFVDDLAFPRGCKFSSWLSSTRNWDLSWWMVLIFVICDRFLRKEILSFIFGGSRVPKFQADQKHTHLDLDFQVPSNNLTFYTHCKVLLEMQLPYFWNSKNRHGCKNIPYFWNFINRSIFGIPLVVTSFSFWLIVCMYVCKVGRSLAWFLDWKSAIVCLFFLSFSSLFFPLPFLYTNIITNWF